MTSNEHLDRVRSAAVRVVATEADLALICAEALDAGVALSAIAQATGRTEHDLEDLLCLPARIALRARAEVQAAAV
jgi:hypothetical protein